jgi:hypothetical protein
MIHKIQWQGDNIVQCKMGWAFGGQSPSLLSRQQKYDYRVTVTI